MILVKLIIAHLLGDLILQPNAWVIAKEQKKPKAWQLYAYALIHFAIINLLIWQMAFIKWALILAGVHLPTDMRLLNLPDHIHLTRCSNVQP